jgi:hypothetical protein
MFHILYKLSPRTNKIFNTETVCLIVASDTGRCGQTKHDMVTCSLQLMTLGPPWEVTENTFK